MILRIDHISIAVKDHAKAEKFFSKLLEFVPGAIGEDPYMNYRYRIYSSGDLTRMEIISPTGKPGLLDGFLKGRDGGVHHITFQVESIKKARDFLERENIPYFGYNDKYSNWKELFVHPSDAFGVLIQFAEFNPHEWISDSVSVPHGKSWEVKREGGMFRFSLLHPGGGKVDTHMSGEEIDALIADLRKIRGKD